MLYQDMTARDLLQQRCTLPNRDTAWRLSPLVTAAIEGKLLLLDLIHKVNLGSLAVVSRSIFPVHTLFRVLALVKPPVMGPQESAAQVSSGWAQSCSRCSSTIVSPRLGQSRRDGSHTGTGWCVDYRRCVRSHLQPQQEIESSRCTFTYDNQHMKVMEDMLKDVLLGAHLLFVGNQVKAVKMSHICVIDEVDKAPTKVTSTLKTLVESGKRRF